MLQTLALIFSSNSDSWQLLTNRLQILREVIHCPCGQAKGDAVTLYSYHDDADDVRRSLKSDHRGT